MPARASRCSPAAAAIWGLATSPVFGLDRLTVQGAALTTEAAISSTIHVANGTNLVTLDTAILGAALEQLPTVASAEVSAGLPGSLTVRITERRPILAWSVGKRRFLVDVDGRVIAELSSGADLPRLDRHGDVVSGAAAGTAGTPVGQVADRRQAGRALAVGDRLNAVDLDAARRLGSLTAADLGSHAGSLSVRVNDKDGFVIAASKGGAAGPPYSASTPRHSGRRSSSRPRSGCSAACWRQARPGSAG